MVTLDRIRLTGLLRKTLANARVFYMTFRYGIVTVRVRQPLGGFTGTARGGPPGRRLTAVPATLHSARPKVPARPDALKAVSPPFAAAAALKAQPSADVAFPGPGWLCPGPPAQSDR